MLAPSAGSGQHRGCGQGEGAIRRDGPELRHPVSRVLYDYWRGLLRPGAVPDRAVFDPMAIPDVLPHLFILEREDDDVIVRLAGTHLDERTVTPMTGRSVFTMYGPAGAAFHRRLFPLLFATPLGALKHVLVKLSGGLWRDADILYLPVGTGADGDIQLVSCAVALDDTTYQEGLALGEEMERISRLTLVAVDDQPLPPADRITADVLGDDTAGHRLHIVRA